jgi:2'-hydroxyisoflavone reductase
MSKRILFIGGTRFIGKTMAEVAMRRGHSVTLFNRGQLAPQGLEGAEQITGDREKDLHPLADGEWDAVIDTCCYLPLSLRKVINAVQGRVGQYLLISTISVYTGASESGLDETGPTAPTEKEDAPEWTMETYGGLKAAAERWLYDEFDGVATVVRPGLVAGPGDYSDRFTYWPVRFHRGGRVLVPDTPDQPVQIIDQRDMAEFTIDLIERQEPGTFNATSPVMELGDFLNRINAQVGRSAEICPVPVSVLAENNIETWTQMPLILPYDGEGRGTFEVSVQKAIDAGLKLRSLEETAQDVLDWWLTQEGRELKTGLSPELESELLEKARVAV